MYFYLLKKIQKFYIKILVSIFIFECNKISYNIKNFIYSMLGKGEIN